ncbi:MAG: mechanosensitive ion channel family protein [Beijerinckiaceae bacterium]|nr:mechanosensitive ion channel family protein [Beijerinckiaceae bacterium]
MKVKELFLAAFFLFALCGPTSAGTALQPPDTSSPHATLRAFEQAALNLRDVVAKYQETRKFADMRAMVVAAQGIVRLFDLEPLPPATREETGREGISLMFDIFNRLPEFDYSAIPGAKGEPADKLPARWSIPGTEIRIGKSESGPFAGEYQFTAETLNRLPEFHARIINEPPVRPVKNVNWSKTASQITGPLVPLVLVESLPAFMLARVLDTPVWKLLASGLLFALLLYAGVRISGRVLAKTSDERPVVRLAGQFAIPLLFGLLSIVWHVLTLSQIHFFGTAARIEEIAALTIVYVCVAWGAALSVFLAIEVIIASPKVPDDSYDAHLLRLLARVLGPIVFGVVLAYGASDLGIPALGIVAGLGVGGIAVALAAQSTIDNLFGGLSIFADRPFRIGDAIQYAGEHGTVASIGLRSTRILGGNGAISIVPNGHLARISITNVTGIERTRLAFIIKIKSDTTPEQITRCMEDLRARALADESVAQRVPSVRLVAYEADAIEIDVKVEIEARKASEIEPVCNRLMLAFASALGQAGVVITSMRVA